MPSVASICCQCWNRSIFARSQHRNKRIGPESKSPPLFFFIFCDKIKFSPFQIYLKSRLSCVLLNQKNSRSFFEKIPKWKKKFSDRDENSSKTDSNSEFCSDSESEFCSDGESKEIWSRMRIVKENEKKRRKIRQNSSESEKIDENPKNSAKLKKRKKIEFFPRTKRKKTEKSGSESDESALGDRATGESASGGRAAPVRPQKKKQKLTKNSKRKAEKNEKNEIFSVKKPKLEKNFEEFSEISTSVEKRKRKRLKVSHDG